MPEKMVLHSVVVVRDGERVEPPIGKAFDFTDAELKDMAKDNPVPFRDVRDESGGNRDVGKGAPVTQGQRGAEQTATTKPQGNPLAGRQTTKPGKTGGDDDDL